MKDILQEFRENVSQTTKGGGKVVHSCTGCQAEFDENSECAGWGYCKECNAEFCVGCLEKHAASSIMAGHRVFDLSDGALREFLLCGVHKGRVVACVCRTCSVPLCCLCVLDHEKTHVLSDITEVIETFEICKEELRTLKDRNEYLQRHLETMHEINKDNEGEMHQVALQGIMKELLQLLDFLETKVKDIGMNGGENKNKNMEEKLLQLNFLQSKLHDVIKSYPLGIKMRERNDSEVLLKRGDASDPQIYSEGAPDSLNEGRDFDNTSDDLLSYRL